MIQTLGTISRLKGFFRSGIYYSCYDDMLNAAERKASGNLPKDILSCLISNNADKKTAIQGTEKIFDEAVDILGEINKLERQAINRMPCSLDFEFKIERFLYNDNIKKLFRRDSIYREKEIETIIKAEEKFLNEIKKYIPETQNVIITPLGCGMFGNGYKLQVFGKNGEQIFCDKVLKVYRENFLLRILQEKQKQYIDALSDRQLAELYNKEREQFKKEGIAVLYRTPRRIRQHAKDNLEAYIESERRMLRKHGAMAEANISEFLRYFSGHNVTPNEGIAIPSFFGLGKTKFSLAEFIDKETKAKKQFNFERLSVRHSDFKNNDSNRINDICVDIGGIVPLFGIKYGKEILSSKQNMHMFKSLFSCPKEKREAILERYKKSGMLSQEILTKLEEFINAA